MQFCYTFCFRVYLFIENYLQINTIWFDGYGSASVVVLDMDS